jgi:hypothetical protein
MRPLAIALGCCLLSGCWVDFPESRLARDGRPDVRVDLPSPGHEVSVADRGDGPVQPPSDAKREAMPSPERGADRPPSDLPPKQDQHKDTQSQTCVPNSFQSCANGDKDIVRCNSTGDGTVTTSCGSGNKCYAGDQKCCPASGCQ